MKNVLLMDLKMNIAHVQELFENDIISKKEYERLMNLIYNDNFAIFPSGLCGDKDCKKKKKDNDNDNEGESEGEGEGENERKNENENENEKEKEKENENGASNTLKPENYEYSEYDEQGNEFHVFYIYTKNEQGKDVLTIRKTRKTIQQTRLKKSVIMRRNISKFGQCSGKPTGPEVGITTIGDLVYFEIPKNDITIDTQQKSFITNSITCRNCNEKGHWTKDCTLKYAIKVNEVDDGKYVPPSKRNGEDLNYNDNTGNIRIGNLDEEANEEDVRELFSPFGSIKRVNVIRDRRTRESKGFAYVEFHDIENAENAIEKLNGYPYGSQILNVTKAHKKN